MANSFSATSANAPHDAAPHEAALWKSLKSAITQSSGFQNWRSEQVSIIAETSSDAQLVRLYLRETLETLAH